MKRKILIIDDDRTNVRITQSALERKGYFVITANNGETGLKKIESGQPDLIILDVQMPEMDGYSFMLSMKKRDPLGKVPVIVVTAYSDLKPIFELHGVKGYIVKPYKINDLIGLIEDNLNNLESRE